MKKLIKRFINKYGYDIVKFSDDDVYAYLLGQKRYEASSVKLLGKDFKIADGHSFYYSHKEIFQEGIYTFKAKNDRPRILDCGSNYGTSITFFKSLYPNAKIIGIEADPRIFDILQTNVKTHNLQDVELHNIALWNEDTTVYFLSEGADSGHIVTEPKAGANVLELPAKNINNFLKEPIDFLKMDIEGAELEVLKTIKDFSNIERMFIEYHAFIGQPQQLDELLTLLSSNGFEYQIHSQYASPQPFIERRAHLDMFLQLNIFAYRV